MITVHLPIRSTVIIEGANIYSPDRARRAARLRMEREVYRKCGVLIAPDYLVNSGGVIFAAQEQLVKTPPHLRIPDQMLGDRQAVDKWLQDHAAEMNELAEKRRKAAEKTREEVIRWNMRELVDLLVADADTLPSEAAERISIRRVARRESDRIAAEIMIPIPTIQEDRMIREAAALLVESSCSILAVVSESNELVGVVTDWDVTRSTAEGISKKQPLKLIMSRSVVLAEPGENLLSMLSKLETNEISALPVVENGKVLGMVSAGLLARRTLLHMLQSQA